MNGATSKSVDVLIVKSHRIFVIVAALAVAFSGCAADPETGAKGADGAQGEAGAAGDKGEPGGKGDKGDPGAAGADGAAGTAGEKGDKGDPGAEGAIGKDGPAGKDGATGKDGPEGKVGPAGKDGVAGKDGAPAGQVRGFKAEITVSKPANGKFFAKDEKPVATITFPDDHGGFWTIEEITSARFQVYGPRAANKAKTACVIMGVTCDYPKPGETLMHHYLDLKTAKPEVFKKVGDGYQILLNAVPAGQEAGPYSASAWVTTKNFIEQDFGITTLQIGTETVEKEIVGGCADCHKGAANGKMYLHHIDPGYSPTGNWSLDKLPVNGCRSCHNTLGYSANPIVRKVHGVHNGSGLRTKANIDPETGAFRNFTHVTFPANVKNCTKCHKDDSWKKMPSRLACGSCHDAINFETGKIDPPTPKGTPKAGKCKVDSDCQADFKGTICVVATGVCALGEHGGKIQKDDTSARSATRKMTAAWRPSSRPTPSRLPRLCIRPRSSSRPLPTRSSTWPARRRPSSSRWSTPLARTWTPPPSARRPSIGSAWPSPGPAPTPCRC